MAGASTTLHEEVGKLKAGTIDRHRALVSLQEELEAVDWYSQRADATEDEELRVILAHNRDEEEEHAAMVLEWLRRHDANLSAQLETYLFKEGSIMAAEGGDKGAATAATGAASDGSLGIGSLHGIGSLSVSGS
ncbi:MAG TPA: encapsulin-associated ferritin-like protein [Alphaproteobacteria bacterium]|nr:encapsulin-associated ferritin-like protein [Alphaproteobacteria bacterium]